MENNDISNSGFRGATILEPNGDSNSNCYDHTMDVVIPPMYVTYTELTTTTHSNGSPLCRGRATMDLRNATTEIIPMRKRETFIFMAASFRVNKIVRRKLACPANYNKTVRSQSQLLLPKNIEKMSNSEQNSYISRLGNSQFCLAPKGLAGRTPFLLFLPPPFPELSL